MNREKIAIVILAAGGSRRFEGSKLLSKLKGRPLISYALNEFHAENYAVKILVVNPRFPLNNIKHPSFKVIVNNEYQKGLSSSLIMAVKEVVSEGCEGFFILLGDMPFLAKADLERLLKAVQDCPDCIIAFRYNGMKGFPTYVPKKYFDRVLSLKGDKGVRQLISAKEAKIKYLEGNWRHVFDVDTPEDLKEAEKFLDYNKKFNETTC